MSTAPPATTSVTPSAPSVEPTVYGVGSANDKNVDFPLDQALSAARACWNLASAVDASKSKLHAGVGQVPAWTGPHRDVFDVKVATYDASAQNVSNALRSLAEGIAAAWAAARGQQDRINFARYCEDEASSDGIGENVVEFFGGETDYGPPPENPSTPGAPGFGETREPMYSQFGP
jgi:hypothetical protein